MTRDTAKTHPVNLPPIFEMMGVRIIPKLELAASALWMWREELPFGLIKTYSDIKFKDIPHHSPI